MSTRVRLWRAAAALLVTIAAVGTGVADRLAHEIPAGAGLHAIIITDPKGDHPVVFRHPGGADTITPGLSADGSQLAYAAKVAGHYKIFAVPLAQDGSPSGEPVQLTSGDSDDEQPAWSRNGHRIAYVSQLGESRTLWVMAAERGPLSEFAKLTTALAGPLSEFAKLTADLHSAAPSWSPDGLAIAFSRDGKLWISHIDTSHIEELYADGVYPSWSRDGAQIAFFSKAQSALMVISPTTKTTRTLASNVESFGETAWSPDGRYIAFKADKVGGLRGSLWVAPASGGAVKPIRTDRAAVTFLDWSWDPATAPTPPPAPTAPTAMITEPYLQQVTQTTQVIMWETDVAGPSAVDYGPDAGYGQTATDDKLATIHEVTLSGLTPDTTYHYRARSGSVASADSTFHTAVRPGTPFRFTACSDNRSGSETWARIAKEMLAEKPAFVLHMGDSLMDGNIYEQWGAQYFRPAADLLRQVPMYIAIGNHERNTHWFFDFHSYPPPEDYYSFDYGSAHFVCVNNWTAYDPQSPQYQWLEKELASDAAQKADWLFVAFHVPGFVGGPDNPVRTYLMPLMTKYGVDLVFSGHTHAYERANIDGVYYIITRGAGENVGGRDEEGRRRPLPPNVAVAVPVFHYCVVDVDSQTLKFKAISIDGELIDSFVVPKRPRPRTASASQP